MCKKSCVHLWVSNNGEGGEPVFCGRSPEQSLAKVYAECFKCKDKNSFTKNQWEYLKTGESIKERCWT